MEVHILLYGGICIMYGGIYVIYYYLYGYYINCAQRMEVYILCNKNAIAPTVLKRGGWEGEGGRGGKANQRESGC